MTYKEVLKLAQHRCLEAGVGEQAPMFLLLEYADMESHSLYEEYETEMPKDLIEKFNAGVERLLKQEPLGHVLGYEYFYGYKFKVNEDVLIPRPETEELVVNILKAYDSHFSGQDIQVIDVGCGSGAIGISLKLEEPHLIVAASDISAEAIEVAKGNAAELGADVEFMVGDMLQPFIEKQMKVDILVSNPPYIPQDEQMETSVIDYEPHVALFGGSDGLKFYREIFKNADKLLKPKNVLAFEMGYDQKENLTLEARKYFPDAEIEVLKDINGKNRMLFIYNTK